MIVVSVCMITYNHAPYIAQAIESVLMQQTSFSIELIIGEDCSTDFTRKICIDYRDKYPDKIKLLLPERNLGPIHNFLATIQASSGKYIALCEGDDYWIDPYKLQKQVDFLDENKDHSLIHTNGFLLEGNKLKHWYEWSILSGEVSETFYFGNIVRTCTALFRSEYLAEYFELLKNSQCYIIGDWPLFAFYSTKGKFGYLNERTSIYRLNPNSVTSRNNSTKMLNYEIDVIEMKRFLRDFIFPGKLDEIYTEKLLEGEIIHAHLKKYFNDYNYKQANLVFKQYNLSPKSLKMRKYTKYRFLFYISAFLRKNRISKKKLIR